MGGIWVRNAIGHNGHFHLVVGHEMVQRNVLLVSVITM